MRVDQNDRKTITRIWSEVFGDDDSYIEYYIDHYCQPGNFFVERLPDGIDVGMVNYPRFTGKHGEVGYMFALGVLPEFRGRRHAHVLIGKLLEACYERGDLVCACYPASDDLHEWYCRYFDFVSIDAPFIFSTPDNMDFAPEPPYVGSGLIRIVDMYRYLSLYASANGDTVCQIDCVDHIIEANTGTYIIKQGTVVHIPLRQNHSTKSPQEIFKEYKLDEKESWVHLYQN